MASESYAAALVAASFNAVPLTGMADGQFIGADKNVDGMTLTVGADGESAVAISADESGTVTITLLNTSISNDYLSRCANLKVRGQLIVKDLSGRMVLFAQDAWVKKQSTVNKSKQVESNAWVFETGNLEMTNNGNN